VDKKRRKAVCRLHTGDGSSGIRSTLGTQFVSPVFSRPPPAQKALEQYYPEISYPQPPISVFPPHQMNLEPLPFTENPPPQSKPLPLHMYCCLFIYHNHTFTHVEHLVFIRLLYVSCDCPVVSCGF